MQRITFNGNTPFEIQNISLQKDGFKVTFTKPIRKGVASKIDNYEMKSYFYKSSHHYGSKQYEMKNFKPKSVSVSEDAKSVVLKLDNLQEGRIFELNIVGDFKSYKDEKVGQNRICYTINKLR